MDDEGPAMPAAASSFANQYGQEAKPGRLSEMNRSSDTPAGAGLEGTMCTLKVIGSSFLFNDSRSGKCTFETKEPLQMLRPDTPAGAGLEGVRLSERVMSLGPCAVSRMRSLFFPACVVYLNLSQQG